MKANEYEVATDPIRDAADLLDRAAKLIVRAAGLVREARCMPWSDKPIEVRRPDPDPEPPVIEPEPDAVTGGWITCGQAARIAGCNSGTITNAANAGKLRTNGESGAARRIDATDLRRWAQARASHLNTGKPASKPARSGPAPTAKPRRTRAAGRALR